MKLFVHFLRADSIYQQLSVLSEGGDTHFGFILLATTTFSPDSKVQLLLAGQSRCFKFLDCDLIPRNLWIDHALLAYQLLCCHDLIGALNLLCLQ